MCDCLFLQDLENYILELIPTLPQLDGLEKSFYSFYVCTAVRKFFFFLDPLHTGNSPVVVLVFFSNFAFKYKSEHLQTSFRFYPVEKLEWNESF